jgi:hypothetical protein
MECVLRRITDTLEKKRRHGLGTWEEDSEDNLLLDSVERRRRARRVRRELYPKAKSNGISNSKPDGASSGISEGDLKSNRDGDSSRNLEVDLKTNRNSDLSSGDEEENSNGDSDDDSYSGNAHVDCRSRPSVIYSYKPTGIYWTGIGSYGDDGMFGYGMRKVQGPYLSTAWRRLW